MFNADGQTTNLAIAEVGKGGAALNIKTGVVGSPIHRLTMTRDEMVKLLPPELFREFEQRGLMIKT